MTSRRPVALTQHALQRLRQVPLPIENTGTIQVTSGPSAPVESSALREPISISYRFVARISILNQRYGESRGHCACSPVDPTLALVEMVCHNGSHGMSPCAQDGRHTSPLVLTAPWAAGPPTLVDAKSVPRLASPLAAERPVCP